MDFLKDGLACVLIFPELTYAELEAVNRDWSRRLKEAETLEDRAMLGGMQMAILKEFGYRDNAYKRGEELLSVARKMERYVLERWGNKAREAEKP